MKKFIVYYEAFGKKMKTTVEASSEFGAKEKIRNKIKFHQVKEVKPVDFADVLKSILGL